ncbi:hypothetical protein ACJX0J_012731, partial [Zea mays]
MLCCFSILYGVSLWLLSSLLNAMIHSSEIKFLSFSVVFTKFAFCCSISHTIEVALNKFMVLYCLVAEILKFLFRLSEINSFCIGFDIAIIFG